MSGGVDSSVAAYSLTRGGYNVVGVFMKQWSPPGMPCIWEREREDALRVASHLGIPIETWDFSRQYERHVAEPMVAGYRRGETPNPDVECNRHIKFGMFANRAFKAGADFIATGHYARTVGATLLKARDENKDQTYFLWAVPTNVLRRTLFPIGHLTKPQVRTLARRAGLSVAEKPDSQGVCFVGEMNVKEFLVQRIRPKTGTILHRDGRVIGRHDGAAYYTIGQRHGLNIRDGGGPYFVLSRDVRRNVVTVGTERDLYGMRALVRDTQWRERRPAPGERVRVRIRHRAALVSATVRGKVITFAGPVRALAPGQSLVFYRGGHCIGGGIMV